MSAVNNISEERNVSRSLDAGKVQSCSGRAAGHCTAGTLHSALSVVTQIISNLETRFPLLPSPVTAFCPFVFVPAPVPHSDHCHPICCLPRVPGNNIVGHLTVLSQSSVPTSIFPLSWMKTYILRLPLTFQTNEHSAVIIVFLTPLKCQQSIIREHKSQLGTQDNEEKPCSIFVPLPAPRARVPQQCRLPPRLYIRNIRQKF